jgi:DNA primase
MTTLKTVAQQVRDRADIVEIIGGYVELRRVGTQYKGLCPFHREKTPSFHVHPGRQGWHCFGCGKGGSIIDFIMGIEKLDFVPALDFLARRLGIDMPRRDAQAEAAGREHERRREDLLTLNQWALGWFCANLQRDPGGAVAAYIARRAITPEIAEAFQLGSSPDAWQALLDAGRAKGFSPELMLEAGLIIQNESGRLYDRFRGRLIFPILDHLGRCLGFGGRIVVEDPEKKLPKYINSNETPVYQKGRNLYGLFQAQEAIARRGRVLLVEGNIDCIMSHQGGFPETVASLGTALTEDQARLLRRYCRDVIFVYDGDEAGQKAMRRGGEILVKAGLNVRTAVLPPRHDPDSLLREEGAEGFTRLLDRASDIFEYLLDVSLPGDRPPEILHRVTAMDAVAPLLDVVQNLVEKQLRMETIGRRLGVDRTVIEEYLARRVKRPATSQPPPEPPPGEYPEDPEASPAETSSSSTDGIPKMDLGILRAIHEKREIRSWILERVELHWLHPLVASVIQHLIPVWETEGCDLSACESALDDSGQRRVLAQALFDDELLFNEKSLEEIRVRLHVRHLKQCGAAWLESAVAGGTLGGIEELSHEYIREFEEFNRRAMESVRALSRKSLIVPTAIRITKI